MSFEETNMLTNGERDDLWRETFKVISDIAHSLQRSNGIECLKMLRRNGRITEEGYFNAVECIAKAEGFKLR